MFYILNWIDIFILHLLIIISRPIDINEHVYEIDLLKLDNGNEYNIFLYLLTMVKQAVHILINNLFISKLIPEQIVNTV